MSVVYVETTVECHVYRQTGPDGDGEWRITPHTTPDGAVCIGDPSSSWKDQLLPHDLDLWSPHEPPVAQIFAATPHWVWRQLHQHYLAQAAGAALRRAKAATDLDPNYLALLTNRREMADAKALTAGLLAAHGTHDPTLAALLADGMPVRQAIDAAALLAD